MPDIAFLSCPHPSSSVAGRFEKLEDALRDSAQFAGFIPNLALNRRESGLKGCAEYRQKEQIRAAAGSLDGRTGRRRRNNKRKRLTALARHRRANVPSGYRGIGDYHSGVYECEFVSPYTKSAGNLDADIMLVLQDWCSDEFLRKPFNPDLVSLGHDPQLPTNRNLNRLLSTHLGIELDQTYATNLFPYIKQGAMSKSPPAGDLKKAAETYTVREIEIVAPQLVICLGLNVYRAIRKSLGVRPTGNLDTAIRSPFQIGEAQVWAQSSPGALGRANRNRGGVDRVAEDWRRMADAIRWVVS